LIALPTLTVLIGSVGDAVSEFVNWYTLWVGKHTMNVWHITQAFTTKKSHQEIKGAAKDVAQDDKDQEAGFREISDLERRQTIPADFPVHVLTDEEAQIAEHKYRPFMMLKAAQKILEHLDEDPPRKYTFKEWAWLLKLLGEDENDSSAHRRVGTRLPDGTEVVSPLRTGKHQVWSWLGQESPLMSLDEGKSSANIYWLLPSSCRFTC
jgi:potassium channel subfamily K